MPRGDLGSINEEGESGQVQKVDLRALKFQAYSEDGTSVNEGTTENEPHTMGEDFDIDIEHDNDQSSVASSRREPGHGHQIHVRGTRTSARARAARPEPPAPSQTEMDIEIDEGEAGGEFGDDGDDDDTSALYFSVSLWRAKSLLGNNAGADGKKTSDPYILVKYGDQELKTRVINENLNPVWRSHVMFAFIEDLYEIELYVFDYENFSSDDLLGKVTLMLPDPLPEEPVFTVLDRAWLKVEPCFTSEQDKLNSHTNMQRRVTKAIRIFHDDAHLYKEDTLGEVMVSVTAFRLEELPALVRDRETTIDRLRNRLTHHRRLSQSTLADTTLRLQAELGGARREAERTSKELEGERSRLKRKDDEEKAAREKLKQTKDELRRALEDKTALEKSSLKLKAARDAFDEELDDHKRAIAGLKKELSKAENARDAALMSQRKVGRELEDLKAKRANDGPVDDFTIEDLQERIHGLTLAYYWMKRQHPRVCNDQMRKHINKYSLPHEPQLKLQET